jgi:hypothetical protein
MQNEDTKTDRGEFYVQAKCCMFCGVPQSIAPELVGWRPTESGASEECYWIRQPANADELTRAIDIIHMQELGCHRYSGNDPEVLRRLPGEDCDAIRPELAMKQTEPFATSGSTPRFLISVSDGSEGILEAVWRKLGKLLIKGKKG